MNVERDELVRAIENGDRIFNSNNIIRSLENAYTHIEHAKSKFKKSMSDYMKILNFVYESDKDIIDSIIDSDFDDVYQRMIKAERKFI